MGVVGSVCVIIMWVGKDNFLHEHENYNLSRFLTPGLSF